MSDEQQPGLPRAPERFWLIPSVWGLISSATKPVKSVGVEYIRFQPPNATELQTARDIINASSCSPMDGYEDLAQRIASALTSAQQRGAELQREVDIEIVNAFSVCRDHDQPTHCVNCDLRHRTIAAIRSDSVKAAAIRAARQQ